MLRLRYQTPPHWVQTVENDLICFLQDHAANERKVSQSALMLATQHPTRSKLVSTLIDIAREELDHFKRVFELLRQRGHALAHDVADPYMGTLHKAVKRPHVEDYLLERLILFGIVEARGHERFGMLASGLASEDLRKFYANLQRAEARHHELYLELARDLFESDRIAARVDVLLTLEADVARALPLRATLF